jgi:hypothetical protein
LRFKQQAHVTDGFMKEEENPEKKKEVSKKQQQPQIFQAFLAATLALNHWSRYKKAISLAHIDLPVQIPTSRAP